MKRYAGGTFTCGPEADPGTELISGEEASGRGEADLLPKASVPSQKAGILREHGLGSSDLSPAQSLTGLSSPRLMEKWENAGKA